MSEVVVNTAEGTNGITFSGKTFTVPVTQDMLETLFNPSIRKSYLEIFVLLSLAANSLVFLFVDSNQLRIKTFIGLYIFWRLLYNFGIGYLLHNQSKYNKLVGWFESWNLFSGKSAVSKLARAEVKAQRGADYSIEAYPIEFNTWLIFRKVVDLILMLDFTTFFCLVVACAIDDDYQFLKYQPTWLTASRLLIGAALIVFNFWVKVNAHNTIKDYAWYWGDFFFRQINNEELIFDGVFEMVPHPMYSVGYVGYYGFALIAKSYTVLTVAIFGHFLQMIFLHFIENPHIDKIYGPSKNEINWQTLLKLKDLKNFNNVKPLVGLYNFNILRSSDIFNLLISITYGIIIPVFAANSNLTSFSVNSWKLDYFFVLAVAIKLFESVFINTSLILQSHYKIFTKWYLSVDAPVENSLENWSVLYNTLINFSYSSLFGLQVYKYILADESTITLFQDWTSLRIFVGCLLIVTQVWINSSIIDLLGYFGWFYGDFFVPKSQRSMAHLTKAGVYRYLNNPEQIFGVCGVMGVFVISPTVENLICSSIWVANNFFRINFIEKVHMIKIYGEQEVSKDSGVTKTFKKHLIPDIIQRRLSESENAHRVGVKTRRQSSIAESVDRFIRDLRNSSTKLSRQHLIELSNNLTFENSDYKLIVNGLRENKVVAGTKEGAFIPKIASIGSPITVSWSSPKESHTTSDWIGLYKIVQTSYSRTKTLISSSGRWNWCTSVEGTMTFEGEKLFWEEGLYEFRYHSGAGHDVSYISEPFEIQTDKVIVPVDEDELVEFAEILKTNIFDKVLPLGTIDDSISLAAENSENIMETFNLLSELISKATDIKISSKIFLNNKDGAEPFTIKKLAKKLIGFRRVLEELSR